MDIVNTFKNKEEISYGYVSLDTIEGSSCVGHWILECSFFLPYIKELQKTVPYKLKILLNGSKMYKTNILSDFDFHEADIVYTTKMLNDLRGNCTWQEKYVIPEDSEYILHIPKFFYLWQTTIHTSLFFECITKFREYYIEKLPNITKSIPITYVARSKKENYKPSTREFINKEEIRNMLSEKGVNILDTDGLTSFIPQFHDIIKSNTIILEMGSAFLINAVFIASNSHIIMINDNWDYNADNNTHIELLRKIMKERNNTVEIFSKGEGTKAFNVDKDLLEKRVSDILSQIP